MSKRKTFAIISHPDAGKTTLTERLLHASGAIHLAGQVKGRGNRRRTRSDWMAIERERGISISSTVMTFEHNEFTFNLLNTPGHEDFSEDTYRTLTAVDSAIMVIDAAKGIESQTRKLFEVCRMREMPILTFINKVDREGRSPFELLDEIENTLMIEPCPIVWPLGMGGLFQGCYNLRNKTIVFDGQESQHTRDNSETSVGINKGNLSSYVSKELLPTLQEDIELAMSAYSNFDLESYHEGYLTPVFFGSALKNITVSSVLEALNDYAPLPGPQVAVPRDINPEESTVTGFVFKIQANMDKKHRDRIAYFRICSGRFQRGMKLWQSRTKKFITINNPIFFFAESRALAEHAFPGDIIGIPNHGTLRVGDTLSEGEELHITGIPNFAPEILRRVKLGDPMRTKQLRSALEDLAEEGVTQVFRPRVGANWIIGVVGQLQLDVLTARIKNEYDLRVELETAPYETARWITSDDLSTLKNFEKSQEPNLADDRDNATVFLARNHWELDYISKKWPKLRFNEVCERG